MKPHAYLMIVAAGLMGAPALVSAQEPAAEAARLQLEGEAQRLSLADVVLMAFERNLDIEIRLLDQQIVDTQVMQEKGIYDPTLAGSVTYSEVEKQGNSFVGTPEQMTDALTVSKQDGTRAEASLNQLLPTGATAYVGAGGTRSTSSTNGVRTGAMDPAIETRGFIGIRQPLLKNFGPGATNLGIRVAEKREAAAQLLYQQEVQNQLAAVMSAYWDLVFALRNLEVQKTSLSAAAELERVNRVKVDTGALARADLLRAQAQVADRRNRVIDAQSLIVTAQDRLRNLLTWDEAADAWNTPIEPQDKPDKYDLTMVLDDQEAVALATTTRPDLRAVALSVEIAELSRSVARLNRLPELNAFAELGTNGLDDNYGDSFDTSSEGDYLDGMVGVEFRYPLLNRRARGLFRQRDLELTRSQRLLQQTELRLLTEVRSATRAIRTAQESIEASLAQVASASETVNAEQRRLEVGSSTTFQVLDAQEDLVSAEVNLISAQVRYLRGLIELHRSQGTLLQRVGQELGVDIVFE